MDSKQDPWKPTKMYVLELMRIPLIFLATHCPNFPRFRLIEGCMIEISLDFDTYLKKIAKKIAKNPIFALACSLDTLACTKIMIGWLKTLPLMNIFLLLMFRFLAFLRLAVDIFDCGHNVLSLPHEFVKVCSIGCWNLEILGLHDVTWSIIQNTWKRCRQK